MTRPTTTADFIKEELEAMRDDQERSFRSQVKAQLRIIADTVSEIEKLNQKLAEQRKTLANMSMTPIDAAKILGVE